MGRRSKIDMSKHKSEIEYLMLEAQWGSLTVSKYLMLKYGEDIAASSLRTWRSRKLRNLERHDKLPDVWKTQEGDGSRARIKRILGGVDEIPDVVTKRLQLAKLQEERIKIDSENELNIGKLFSSQSREIELLNKIYSDVKSDLQDMGVLPTREGTPSVQVNTQAFGGNAQAAQVTPEFERHTPVSEALEGVPAEVLSEAGRTLVLLRQEPETVEDEPPDA